MMIFKNNLNFLMIAVLAVAMTFATSCNKDDDEPTPEPETTANVQVSLEVRDAVGSIDVKEWKDLTVDLDTDSGVTVQSVKASSSSVSFSNIAPGNYIVDVYGTVNNEAFGDIFVTGFQGVQLLAGDSKSLNITLE